MQKGSVYAVVFGAIAVILAVYVAWKTGALKTAVERFTDTTTTATTAAAAPSSPAAAPSSPAAAAAAGEPLAVNEGTYSSQLYVIRTFETLLGRKPTVEELKKYSVLLENNAILAAISKDHNVRNEDAEAFSASPPESSEQKQKKDDDDDDDSELDDDSECSSDDDDVPSAWPPRQQQHSQPRNHPRPNAPPQSSQHQKCKPFPDFPKGIVCVDRADLMSRLKAISNEVDCFYDMLRLMK